MLVVWLKRDLRLDDHAPLAHAAAACALDGTPMIALAAFEPEVWQAPDADASHLGFYLESLAELEEALRARGGAVAYRVGEITDPHDPQGLASPCESPIFTGLSAAIWDV